MAGEPRKEPDSPRRWLSAVLRLVSRTESLSIRPLAAYAPGLGPLTTAKTRM